MWAVSSSLALSFPAAVPPDGNAGHPRCSCTPAAVPPAFHAPLPAVPGHQFPCRHGPARPVSSVIHRDVCFLQGHILPYWIRSHNHGIQHPAFSNDQYLMFQMKLKAPNNVTGELCVAQGRRLFYWLWVLMELKTQLLP